MSSGRYAIRKEARELLREAVQLIGEYTDEDETGNEPAAAALAEAAVALLRAVTLLRVPITKKERW